MANTLKVALDWTPNTNHTGFFVALEKGFYKELGLEVVLISPAADQYQSTPARRLAAQEVDVAIAPTESIISYYTHPERPVRLKAIATLLQEDASAIVTLRSSGISRPAQLEGKVYASFQAKYEDKIVQEMVRSDGGQGALNIIYPAKLGIWNTLLSGQADASWIFTTWEGVEAEGQGIALNYFKMQEFGIPYGYSPVLLVRQEALAAQRRLYQDFLSATKKGFTEAVAAPEEAVEILGKHVPEVQEGRIDLLQSQQRINQLYGDQRVWGYMDMERCRSFLSWLYQKKLIETPIAAEELFSNDLL